MEKCNSTWQIQILNPNYVVLLYAVMIGVMIFSKFLSVIVCQEIETQFYVPDHTGAMKMIH